MTAAKASSGHRPMAAPVVGVVLWLVLVALLITLGWLMFAACGVAIPGSAPFVQFCDRPNRDSDLMALQMEEQNLRDAVTRLEQALGDVPACAEDCVFTRDDQKTDVYFLQDLSQSFDDDLPNITAALDAFTAQVASGDLGSDVYLGLGSFIDKPIPPYGDRGDYVFRSHASLAPDADLSEVLRSLSVGSGGESIEEAQFEALVELSGRADELGFRDDAKRYVIVVTDAPAFVEGALRRARAKEDGEADGDPLNEDYPSAATVSRILKNAGIEPIFVVGDPAVVPFYEAFVASHGRGAVVPLSSSGEDLLHAIFAGLREECV